MVYELMDLFYCLWTVDDLDLARSCQYFVIDICMYVFVVCTYSSQSGQTIPRHLWCLCLVSLLAKHFSRLSSSSLCWAGSLSLHFYTRVTRVWVKVTVIWVSRHLLLLIKTKRREEGRLQSALYSCTITVHCSQNPPSPPQSSQKILQSWS